MFTLLSASFLLILILNDFPISLSSPCNEKCGKLQIPFPFHLNSSCGSAESFHLSCKNSSTLLLNISSQSYRVLEFFSDGVIVDFPGFSSCRQYNDLNSFGFQRNAYFGISTDNVIGLYDCDDSSLCKADCETNLLPGCDGNGSSSPACCYPLKDHSEWHVGDDFSVFSKFGCRGYSSWVVPRGSNFGKRGVKLEWAIPGNESKGACATNGYAVNATVVEAGVRCFCQDDYVGDGFANGTGCLKSCIKDEMEAYGNDCYVKQHSEKKLVVLTGVLGPVFVVASLIGLICILKRPDKQRMLNSNNHSPFHSNNMFQKACGTRLFTYEELEDATRGFGDSQKLAESSNGTIYAGVLGDGSNVAVHKEHCPNKADLVHVLSRIEALSTVLHQNMATLLGCCIVSGFFTLVVYDHHPANGTLEEHLHYYKGKKVVTLDWYRRLSIARETAGVLSFLQYEISPPILHRDLKASFIFLDNDLSAKIAGFRLLNYILDDENSCMNKSDVYDFGLVLVEIIAGSNNMDPMVVLQKIRSGKIEEVVDPVLYYHEQPSFVREQIEVVADLATRCLLFGRHGKLGMNDVARELVHITKESSDGGGSLKRPALEETFSNSSLLQMISMSPDSIHVP